MLGDVIHTKSQTLRKKKDNLRYVFIYKIWTLCVTQFFIKFLKLAEGGVFYMEKTIHFTLHFYTQKPIHFPLRLYIYKARHFALRFNMQKKFTLRYVFIYKLYCIVLITNYKRTYDQSNQIEK